MSPLLGTPIFIRRIHLLSQEGLTESRLHRTPTQPSKQLFLASQLQPRKFRRKEIELSMWIGGFFAILRGGK